MQLKLFVSLLVLGFASAAYLGGKVISVNDDDIQVASQNGVKVNIYRNRLDNGRGLKGYEVTVAGPNFVKKTVRLNDQEGGKLVSEVFVKHQGVVDEATFNKILNNIERFVLNGEVDPAFYNVLRILDNQASLQDFTIQDIFGQGQLENQGGIYGGFYEGRQGRFQQFNKNYGSQSSQNKEELVQDVLRKEAKVDALNQAQEQASVTKNQLEREIVQEQNQNKYGSNRYQTEDILNKESRIQALREFEQNAQIAKDVLEQQIAQEEQALNNQGPFYQRQYQGQYGFGSRVGQGYYNQGFQGYQGQYQHPSVFYRTQTPFSLGGRYFGNAQGFNQYGLNQLSQPQRQLVREIEREVEQEIEQQLEHQSYPYGQKYGHTAIMQGEIEREIEQEVEQKLANTFQRGSFGSRYNQQQLAREIEQEIEEDVEQKLGEQFNQQRYFGKRYPYGQRVAQRESEDSVEREVEQEVKEQLENQRFRSGQGYNTYGQRFNTYGQRFNSYGQRDTYGPRYNTYGQRFNSYGPRSTYGQRYNTFGQRYNAYGQRDNAYGQRYNTYGQQYNTFGQRYNTFGDDVVAPRGYQSSGYSHYVPQNVFNDYLNQYQRYYQTPAVQGIYAY